MNINDLDRCPSTLKRGFKTYAPSALKSLFDGTKISHILSVSPPSGQAPGLQPINNAARLSLSGVQPKFGLILDDKKLRYSQAHEQSQFILKPKPTAYHIIKPEYCAANEHATMQLAAQVFGINVAPNALCFFQNGEAAYLTRRFDVNGNGKFAMEDFASLMGLTKANGGSDFKYIKASYEECAEIIHEFVKSYLIDILQFFKLILFNFITLNDDAHLKNFSLLSNGREYHLSPAYDLINTSLHIWEPRIFALEKGLFKEGMSFSDTRQISYKDFAEFGRRIGIPQKLMDLEIINFATPKPEIEALIERSFLSSDLKQHYIRSLRYRQKLLIF